MSNGRLVEKIEPISLRYYRRLGRLLIAGTLALHVFFLWSIRGRIVRGDPDFTIYFTAGKLLREGQGRQLYDPVAQYRVQQEFATDSDIRRGALPYIHPPFEALLFLPLTFLPYTDAYLVWNALNCGMLFWVCILLRRSLVSLQKIPLADCWLACLAFFPILGNFHQGQDAILLLLVSVIAFRALDRGAEFSSGCWLGVGLFKFQFMLPIALILVLWRGRKLAAGFTMVASAAVAVSIALVGWSAALHYPIYAWEIVSTVRSGGLPYRLMPNLTGLINGWPILESVGWPLRFVAFTASTALLVIIAVMRRPARQAQAFNLCLACVVIASVTVSYNTNSYDLSLLVLSIALVLDHCLRASPQRQKIAALFLPASPLLFSPLWFFLWQRWERTNLMAIPLLWWCSSIWREARRAGAARNDETGASLIEPYRSPPDQEPQAVT